MSEQLSWRMPPMPHGEPRPELQAAGIQCRSYGEQREVWRVEHKRDAFVDASGQERPGDVVHEQVVVTIIGREDYHDGYANNPDAALICVDERGRRFRYRPNTVDYVGGGSWVRVDENGEWVRGIDGPGFWSRPPWMPDDAEGPKGYFHTDGSAPVKPLLSDKRLR